MKETFEAHLEKIEAIVEELEAGELDLAGSMERYQDGVKSLKHCYELLRKAEQQVRMLVRDAGGELSEQPFESEDE